MNEYVVYVRYNVDGVITSINSNAFLSNVEINANGWVQIDRGTGDKYHHAQGNYLDVGLTDNNGIYNYKLVDGVVVLRTVEDKVPEIQALEKIHEIAQLKQQLVATDYIAAKIAEGAATTVEYAAEIAQRATWRARINELEG